MMLKSKSLDVVNNRARLLAELAFQPYIDLPNFVDHLTRKPYAYRTRCKCKITRFKLASRETGIKRFPAWTLRWLRSRGVGHSPNETRSRWDLRKMSASITRSQRAGIFAK